MVVTRGDRLTTLPQVAGLSAELRRDIDVVSRVLPFKVNNYVLEHLIDWAAVPDDPMYRLTFPHRDMLADDDYQAIAALLDRGAPEAEIRAAADAIRWKLNPHPSGQLEHNVPTLDGEPVSGLQHKYRETLLVFPSAGQTCHSYCGYCFRWAQFVGMDELRQAHRDIEVLGAYLARHRCVTDVLFTGGDPMVMSTSRLAAYFEPLLAPELEHIRTIRVGTKALAYWPYRFTTDKDADDFLRLIERCTRRGKHVAVMAHFTHRRELESSPVERAIRRLRSAGAVIRTQSPVIRHVNDSAEAWASMWRRQVQLDLVPYYFFVERDTGARRYFAIPLARAFDIYREATNSLSGLGRTARGPVMSATPGKVTVDGILERDGTRYFALRMLQSRNPDWSGRPFLARYDDTAAWFDELRPADDASRFFFEDDPVQDWRAVPAADAADPFAF